VDQDGGTNGVVKLDEVRVRRFLLGVVRRRLVDDQGAPCLELLTQRSDDVAARLLGSVGLGLEEPSGGQLAEFHIGRHDEDQRGRRLRLHVARAEYGGLGATARREDCERQRDERDQARAIRRACLPWVHASLL
jgi:hypothetical protein